MRIDWWTLGLQTVNVLILVAILARFLFRPVIAIMEERQAAAAKLMSDAEAEKAKAIAAREAAEIESDKIAAARDAVLRQAAEEANAQREAALAAAKEDADQVRSAAETEMRWARAAEESAASDRSARLAVDVARKLVERLPDTARGRRLHRRTRRARWRRCPRRAATASAPASPAKLTAPSAADAG